VVDFFVAFFGVFAGMVCTLAARRSSEHVMRHRDREIERTAQAGRRVDDRGNGVDDAHRGRRHRGLTRVVTFARAQRLAAFDVGIALDGHEERFEVERPREASGWSATSASTSSVAAIPSGAPRGYGADRVDTDAAGRPHDDADRWPHRGGE
jgi:hypothetical protein